MKRYEIIFDKAHEAGWFFMLMVIGMVIGVGIGHWQVMSEISRERYCEELSAPFRCP
jgi:hypothetical protein